MTAHTQRINNFHKWSLLGIAFSIDFLQAFLTFIPLLGPFLASSLTIVARIIFWIWFRMLHVGFADKSNRFFVNISITIIEFLPLINFVPSWSIGTWMIIKQVEKEDKTNSTTLTAANDNQEQEEMRMVA